jgi:plasmid stabilization system protein ParE
VTARRPKPVRWQSIALAGVEALTACIAEQAPRAAERFARRLIARAELLADFPYLGAKWPEYRRARFVVHGKYVIYYTVHRREVVIRAVVHGARRFDRSWLRLDD